MCLLAVPRGGDKIIIVLMLYLHSGGYHLKYLATSEKLKNELNYCFKIYGKVGEDYFPDNACASNVTSTCMYF